MERPRTWLPLFPPLPFHHLRRGATALLAVDMQYLDAHRDYGMSRRRSEPHSGHRRLKCRLQRTREVCGVCRSYVVLVQKHHHVSDDCRAK